MELTKTASIRRVKLRHVLFVVAVSTLTGAAFGRSCIVNAGTETYAQSSAPSVSVSMTLSSSATSVLPVSEAVETRSCTVDVSAGRSLSTMPPGCMLIFR